MLFDTHCHLTDERYRHDLSDVLVRAAEGGVRGIVAVASDLEDAKELQSLWNRERSEGASGRGEGLSLPVWGTAGVHPHQSARALDALRERLLDALHSDERVVAVGECGLDYHYDFSPRDKQRRVFDRHIEVAEATGKPLVVHCREAEEDMRRAVRDAGTAGVRGVLHCFLGDPRLLDDALAAGWTVSFTGIVTFSSFEGEEAVRRVPSDRYMLETDGPYLAPVPHRGKRNEPGWVAHVRDRVAEIRGETSAQVEEDTGSNAMKFFGIEREESELEEDA